MIKTFCVAHKPITYPLPDDVPVIWLGGATPQTNGKHKIFQIAEISEEFDAWHPFLAGSSGSFAIEKMLTEDWIDWTYGDQISIVQYRKFILPQPLENMEPDQFNLYVPQPDVVKRMDFHALQNEIELPYLLAKPVDIGNRYLQYAYHHKIQDLLRYTALAIDMKIISDEESYEFLNSPVLIQGGVEFGVYPISVFMEFIKPIRELSMEFLKCHRPVSSDIQHRRAVAFCNERLGSYLLMKRLNEEFSDQVPENLFGYMHYAI